MSEEGFRRYLRPYVDKKIPFLAYWHPQGFGVIRLDEVMVPDVPKDEVQALSGGPRWPHRLTKGRAAQVGKEHGAAAAAVLRPVHHRRVRRRGD